MSLPPDTIEALAALNAAHERVDICQKATQQASVDYSDALNNANKLQKAFDDLVEYLHANAPEGTTWWQRHGDGS